MYIIIYIKLHFTIDLISVMLSYDHKDIIKMIISWDEVNTMKNILIVVDMQKDFIGKTLGTKEAVGIVQMLRIRLLNMSLEVMK